MTYDSNKSVIENRRAKVIERMEAGGSITPDCSLCQQWFYPAEDPSMVMAPRHKASPRCESGKHPHCTCDTCF